MIYPNLSSIVCCDADYGIGKFDKIPWLDRIYSMFLLNTLQSDVKNSIKKDLQHFQQIRKKYDYLVVGSKTFSTLPYLEDSKFIIITSNCYKVKGILENQVKYFEFDTIPFLSDLGEGFYEGKCLCIGGESIYKQLLPSSSILYLTKFKNLTFDCNKFVDKSEIDKFKLSKILYDDEYLTISIYEK
jgi:dihydrofolate reductase